MLKKFFTLLTLASISTHSFYLRAQDYPYENPSDEAKLPRESPDESISPRALEIRKKKSRHSWAIKAGINYTVVEEPSLSNPLATTSTKGVGAEGMISYGTDLVFQPIFLEVESGYRMLLASQNSKVHVVPLRLGAFYRERVGETSVWRPGVVASIDFKMAKDDANKNVWAIVPSLGLSTMWDIGHFLIEGIFNLHRIETQYNYYDFSFRLGYRF